MATRGFTMEPSGRWHGPFNIRIPATYNDLDTTGLADFARNDTIQYVDRLLASKRRGAGNR